MRLKPIYNRLVIKRDEPIKQTEGGIFVVTKETRDRNELKPEGVVLEVGHDVQDVQKGDRVVFRRMSGTEVQCDGQDLLVMTEDDVMAILT